MARRTDLVMRQDWARRLRRFEASKLSTRHFLIRRVLRSAVLAWGLFGQAHAAIYQFSFDNVNGPVAGTVMGQFELPDGDGTFAATALTITSAPAALGYSLPYDVFANMSTSLTNSFTVSGGAIASGSQFARQYTSPAPAQVFSLNFASLGSLLNVRGSSDPYSGVRDVSSTTLAYTTAVPEPSTLILGVAGLVCAACRFAQRRKGRCG